MWNQSNYPSGGYGGGYAPSSGPPPPPGMAAGGYSAYNVNQYPSYPYAGYMAPRPPQPIGYGYGSYGAYGAPAPSPYGYGGAHGYGQPAQPPAGYGPPQAGYGGPAGPAGPYDQPGGTTPSMAYNMMQDHLTNMAHHSVQWRNMQQMGLVDDPLADEMEREMKRRMTANRRGESSEEDLEDMKRKYEERIAKAEERQQELLDRLQQDDGLKTELRERFINELMRRQDVNGTFEEVMGTVFPFNKYDEEDQVRKWFLEEKGQDINGEDWDPLYDAEYLYSAIKGWGTDEEAIISVTTTRCNSQRNRILKEFKTAYGRDLIKHLKGDLSGHFEDVILGLFETPARYDAWHIKKSIYGLGTDEGTLIEVLLTRTNGQIREMVQEYNNITYEKQKNPESALEEDITDDTSGSFKRMLISAGQGNRRLIAREKLEDAVEAVESEGQWTGMFRVNYAKLCHVEKCQRMAQELFDAGEERWGTDEDTFNRIFSTQDYYTLRMIWEEYVKISQRDILNSVDREYAGSSKKGLRAIAQVVKCRPMYFAERLYKGMRGIGTKDSRIIRIVIARSEIDMMQIKACFLEKYGKTLWHYINKDTSGDYKNVLLAIVGKN